MRPNDANLDLVGSFLQVEGQFKINSMTHNYDSKGGVLFSGYRQIGIFFPEYETVKISMDNNQVELINGCNGVIEVYKCYQEMEYFPTCAEGGRTDDNTDNPRQTAD